MPPKIYINMFSLRKKIYINMHVIAPFSFPVQSFRINKMILLGSNNSRLRKESCIKEFLLAFTFPLWMDNVPRFPLRLGIRIRLLLGVAIPVILFVHVRYGITGSP